MQSSTHFSISLPWHLFRLIIRSHAIDPAREQGTKNTISRPGDKVIVTRVTNARCAYGSSRSSGFWDSLRVIGTRLLISGVGCWDVSPDRSMRHPALGVVVFADDVEIANVCPCIPRIAIPPRQECSGFLKLRPHYEGAFALSLLSLPLSLSLSLPQEKGGKWRALLIVHATVSRRCKCARLSRAAKYRRTLKSIMRSPYLCLSRNTIAKMRVLAWSSFH